MVLVSLSLLSFSGFTFALSWARGVHGACILGFLIINPGHCNGGCVLVLVGVTSGMFGRVGGEGGVSLG